MSRYVLRRLALGVSLWTKEPVLDEILQRLPVSIELALLAMVCGLLIALPMGIISAVRQDHRSAARGTILRETMLGPSRPFNRGRSG